MKLKGRLTNSLYVLEGSTIIGTVVVASLKDWDDSKLWHERLGHIGENGLVERNKPWLLEKSTLGTLGLCEHCIYGKATRVSFRKGKHISNDILDFAHADLWWLAQTTI